MVKRASKADWLQSYESRHPTKRITSKARLVAPWAAENTPDSPSNLDQT
jgi:hypothetical protein